MYFIKYMPGNIYQNTYALSIAEISGNLLGCYLLKCLGLKRTFLVGFCTSLAGGLLIQMAGTSQLKLVPTFVLLAKLGVSINLNMIFTSTPMLFPTLFVGTAFGITNFTSRLFTVLSPLVAEMPQPIPMIVFCSSTALAIAASFLLRTGSAHAE